MTERVAGAEQRVASAEHVGRTCPYCRFPLKQGGQIAVCSECHAAHHLDCWGDNDGCAVMGCASAPGKHAHNGAATQPLPVTPPAPAGGNGKAEDPTGIWPTAQTPQPPPPPSVSPSPGGKSRIPGLTIAIVVLALAIGGVAAALVITQKSSHTQTTITQVSGTSGPQPGSNGQSSSSSSGSGGSTGTGHGSAGSTGTGNSGNSGTAQSGGGTGAGGRSGTSGVSPGSGGGSTSGGTSSGNGNSGQAADAGAAAALRHYWDLVAQGDYQGAYNMETSDEQAKEPNFVQDRNTGRPTINIASIGSATPSSDGADVPIEFYAQNQTPSANTPDTKCWDISLTAHMVQNSDGSWSYGVPSNGQQSDGGSNCHP